MTKKQKPQSLLTFTNEGFVSGYFMIILFYLSILLGISFQNLDDSMTIYQNMEKLDEYLVQEAAVISYVNNHLQNDDLENGSYYLSTASFSLSIMETEIHVEITDPLKEHLILEIQDGLVYDYAVQRYEKQMFNF